MSGIRVFRVDNYELTCAALQRDDGGFEPSLVVRKVAWPSRPRTIAVSRESLSTEDQAIQTAYAQGVEWINHYG